MADNRPLIVQRQLSRLDSPENHDTYTLQWQTLTTQAGWLGEPLTRLLRFNTIMHIRMHIIKRTSTDMAY